MYRSNLKPRDKTGALAAVIAVHAVLALMLLHLSGKMPLPDVQSALKVFDTAPVPPPPPVPPPHAQSKPKQKEGASAPTNKKSQAAPVKRPPLPVPVPIPTPASTARGAGKASAQGAATPGVGTGGGGFGVGTGSGIGGNGAGGGGGGGVAEPPHLATPVLGGRDFQYSLLNQWPRNSTVFLRLRVDARGYIAECMVDRGTGVASIDSTICDLARERLHFRPALNRAGQAIAGWFGYAQPAPR